MRAVVHDGIQRVEAAVNDIPLWFESPSTPLAASVEAFGSALLFAAASQGRQLAMDSPPDSVWLKNIHGALAVAANWWGYPSPLSAPRAATALLPPASASSTGETALCFSGGVDSFYTLLRGGLPVELLTFVHGFDIPLADESRAATSVASLRAVADQLGIRAVILRTNLREHPVLQNVNWEQVHGGALAAAGHLLGEDVNRLLISASYPRAFNRPWGSHWELDPWWSSSHLAVVHAGAEKWRSEKLVAMLDEPLVRSHLRVCWENRSPTGNCGACEKCLRTMLVLDGHGRLDDFPVFPNAARLGENLAQLKWMRPDLVRVYTGFLDLDLSSVVRSSLEALLERSEPQPGSAKRWWRRRRHE